MSRFRSSPMPAAGRWASFGDRKEDTQDPQVFWCDSDPRKFAQRSLPRMPTEFLDHHARSMSRGACQQRLTTRAFDCSIERPLSFSWRVASWCRSGSWQAGSWQAGSWQAGPSRRSRLPAAPPVRRREEMPGSILDDLAGAEQRRSRRTACRSAAGPAACPPKKARPAPRCRARPAMFAVTVKMSLRYIWHRIARHLADAEGRAGRGRRQDHIDLAKRPRRNRA